MNPETLFAQIDGMSEALRTSVIASLRSPEEIKTEAAHFKEKKLPLAGTSCFLKDCYDVEGLSTRASSRFLEQVRPGLHTDGALATHLRSLGVSIVGKTQMNEFAYGLDGANPHYGDCPHPFLPGHCSGGSSSGSAWVVAKGLVPLAFGTDTGGSIRVPAAFCGIVGLRIPPNDWAEEGCFPLSPSFDTVGWFTSTLPDMARYSRLLLDLPEHENPSTPRIFNGISGHEVLTPFVRKFFPQAEVCDAFLDPREAEERLMAFSVLQSREAMAVHRDWIDDYADTYDPKVRALILRARSWTHDEIERARCIEKLVNTRLGELFQETDMILLPVSPDSAPVIPMTHSLRSALLTQTVIGSLGRLPILTLPVKSPEGPLGVQCLLPPERWREVLVRLFRDLSMTGPFFP